jgi:DNA-binding NarL/FixJ family response regulator
VFQTQRVVRAKLELMFRGVPEPFPASKVARPSHVLSKLCRIGELRAQGFSAQKIADELRIRRGAVHYYLNGRQQIKGHR